MKFNPIKSVGDKCYEMLVGEPAKIIVSSDLKRCAKECLLGYALYEGKVENDVFAGNRVGVVQTAREANRWISTEH